MTPTVWLTLISVGAASALFIALAVFLILILRELTPTGGTATSFLGKIRLGLRAIEIETSHIPVEVTKLNAGLYPMQRRAKPVGRQTPVLFS